MLSFFKAEGLEKSFLRVCTVIRALAERALMDVAEMNPRQPFYVSNFKSKINQVATLRSSQCCPTSPSKYAVHRKWMRTTPKPHSAAF
jgi:hypothetical protein